MTSWSFEEGFKTEDYNREIYYKQLEREALERARKAQEKLLAEGKQLPLDAINLVDVACK